MPNTKRPDVDRFCLQQCAVENMARWEKFGCVVKALEKTWLIRALGRHIFINVLANFKLNSVHKKSLKLIHKQIIPGRNCISSRRDP